MPYHRIGNARDTSVLPTILEKAKKLEPEDYLSHFRAITMATEAIGSREAVPVLLAMLTTPGVRGHSILSFAEARSNAVPDLNDTSTRNLALKELHLARAFTYAATRTVSEKRCSAGMPTVCKATMPVMPKKY